MSEGGRIFWNDVERAKIIEQVFSMRQNDPESSLTAIVNRAVAQLPKERQRQIPSVKSIPWLPEAIKNKFAEQRKIVRSNEQAQSTVAAATKQHIELQATLTAMVDNARQEALVEADLVTLLVAVADKLQPDDNIDLKAIKTRVARLELILSDAGELEQPEAPAPAPTKKKPTILIVGMLPNQNRELLTHFGKNVSLIFMDRDDEKGKVPLASAAVINAKFIKHALQSRIQSEMHGRAKVYLVKGGLTSVKERIETVLSELGCQSTKELS